LTKAQETIDNLYQQFGIPKDSFMRHDYLMICHSCGKLHKVRSEFISSPLAIGFTFSDGSTLSIPANGCPVCMAIKLPREQHPIFLAWSKGMTREAYNHAAQSIGANLQPEPKPCRLCHAVDSERHLSANGAHQLCAQLFRRGLPTPALKTDVR
jgi:hypothetical protein